MSDFDTYRVSVDTLRAKHPDQRSGQAAFNALFFMAPTLADKIRGGLLDPFYNDARLSDFYEYVKCSLHVVVTEGEEP